jgi:hypothetical protein
MIVSFIQKGPRWSSEKTEGHAASAGSVGSAHEPLLALRGVSATSTVIVFSLSPCERTA